MLRKTRSGLRLAHGLHHRLAVREFLGIDAGAMQDERQEVANAALLVDDEAYRHAAAGRGGIARARLRQLVM